jgi:bifunctional non-homologous end joining protein LigD
MVKISMAEKLREYERKRDFKETPEPKGGKRRKGNRFVVQEHHARRLHWDLRLERDGVLVSWAVPKGIPMDPKTNHLAVHVEDHPLDYIDFEGEIPAGNYGAGKVIVWDSGTYEAEKFRENEVIATFHGERVQGKYAIFQTRGKDWMIHRMDPPADPEREPMPDGVEPMKARTGNLPRNDEDYGYEIKWDGIRAIAYIENGRLLLRNRNLRDMTSQYPELRELGRVLGSTAAVLDGEVVAFDDQGQPSFQALQGRMHLASEAAVRRAMKHTPVAYVIFDVLYHDGRSTMNRTYEERRALLDELKLQGPHWQAPAWHRGDGAALREASRAQGLEGVIAKRLDSCYWPGRRSAEWIKVKNTRSQEVVIGGWFPGEGGRSGRIGSLLAGVYDGDELKYVGNVGTGFTEKELDRLYGLLEPLRRKTSPFSGRQPKKGSIFCEPELVADVEYLQWTQAGTLRAPSYKGLRDDLDPRDVVREPGQ